jgi:hypothetical protein
MVLGFDVWVKLILEEGATMMECMMVLIKKNMMKNGDGVMMMNERKNINY